MLHFLAPFIRPIQPPDDEYKGHRAQNDADFQGERPIIELDRMLAFGNKDSPHDVVCTVYLSFATVHKRPPAWIIHIAQDQQTWFGESRLDCHLVEPMLRHVGDGTFNRNTAATRLVLLGSGLDYCPVPEQGGNTERRALISKLTQDVHLCYSMSSLSLAAPHSPASVFSYFNQKIVKGWGVLPHPGKLYPRMLAEALGRSFDLDCGQGDPRQDLSNRSADVVQSLLLGRLLAAAARENRHGSPIDTGIESLKPADTADAHPTAPMFDVQ